QRCPGSRRGLLLCPVRQAVDRRSPGDPLGNLPYAEGRHHLSLAGAGLRIRGIFLQPRCGDFRDRQEGHGGRLLRCPNRVLLRRRNDRGLHLLALRRPRGGAQPSNWIRSSLGRAKTMFSGSPARSWTPPSAPSSRRRAMTSCTSTSGADAPAVTPIRALPASHSGRRSAAPSIRSACTPSRWASSRRRLELELLAEPTTSTRSAWPASTRTASWRFWVA